MPIEFSPAVFRSTLALLAAALLLPGCHRDETIPTATEPAERPAASAAPTKIVTKTGVEMVLIPRGRFFMGDDGGEDDEKPAHEVELAHSTWTPPR
jgi:formylglycine-generating enzyme required for sulfatase activity